MKTARRRSERKLQLQTITVTEAENKERRSGDNASMASLRDNHKA